MEESITPEYSSGKNDFWTRFPLELWLMIIQHATYSSKSTAAALCSVTKWIRDLCTPLLYESLVMDSWSMVVQLDNSTSLVQVHTRYMSFQVYQHELEPAQRWNQECLSTLDVLRAASFGLCDVTIGLEELRFILDNTDEDWNTVELPYSLNLITFTRGNKGGTLGMARTRYNALAATPWARHLYFSMTLTSLSMNDGTTISMDRTGVRQTARLRFLAEHAFYCPGAVFRAFSAVTHIAWTLTAMEMEPGPLSNLCLLPEHVELVVLHVVTEVDEESRSRLEVKWQKELHAHSSWAWPRCIVMVDDERADGWSKDIWSRAAVRTGRDLDSRANKLRASLGSY